MARMRISAVRPPGPRSDPFAEGYQAPHTGPDPAADMVARPSLAKRAGTVAPVAPRKSGERGRGAGLPAGRRSGPRRPKRHLHVSKASPAVPGVAHRSAGSPGPMDNGASAGNSPATVPISSPPAIRSRRRGMTGQSPSRLDVTFTARMPPGAVSIAGWTSRYWRRRDRASRPAIHSSGFRGERVPKSGTGQPSPDRSSRRAIKPFANGTNRWRLAASPWRKGCPGRTLRVSRAASARSPLRSHQGRGNGPLRNVKFASRSQAGTDCVMAGSQPTGSTADSRSSERRQQGRAKGMHRTPLARPPRARLREERAHRRLAGAGAGMRWQLAEARAVCSCRTASMLDSQDESL